MTYKILQIKGGIYVMEILVLTRSGKHGRKRYSKLEFSTNMHLSESKTRNKSKVPWLTSSIKLQIRERDRLTLFAKKHNSAYYWNAYKLSRNRVTQALREAKSAHYKRQFVSVTNKTKS